MKTLCIIQCGVRKVWNKHPDAGPTQARDVYIGSFARKCQEYAVRFYPSEWCILSAKHGFLLPQDIVEKNYNVTFNDNRTKPIGLQDLRSQIKTKGLDRYDQIVVPAAKQYAQIIKDTFSGREILTPLGDCRGIGYMMGKLNEALKKGTPL